MSEFLVKELRVYQRGKSYKIPRSGDVRVSIFDTGDSFKVKSFSAVDGSIYQEEIEEPKKDWIKATESGQQTDWIGLVDFYFSQGSWEIRQDPFSEDVDYQMDFGSTGYPLNNGSTVRIDWISLGNPDAKAGKIWSDNRGFELETVDGDTKSNYYKKVTIDPPRKVDHQMTFEAQLMYLKDSPGKEFEASLTDLEILSKIINDWRIKVPNYEKLAAYNPTVIKLVEWSKKRPNVSKFIDILTDEVAYLDTFLNDFGYKSPLANPTGANNLVQSGTSSVAKEKINFILPTSTILAKDDLPTITIFIGPTFSLNGPNNTSNFIEDEYAEGGFLGEEETGLTKEEWIEQDSASKQEDSSNPSFQAGPPADIKPVTSFDALINLADRCARELGKNPRVNSENMKISYKDGVHGLCPQGTQAVLYALTGIKQLGSIRGNADWFSFKSPTQPPGGDGKGDFAKTGFYNDKVQIKQIGGSWKGTYLDNRSKSQWQVGDVIAMGYVQGKNYGHIQVWTGYCWMSDFKQSGIQQNHVDPDSVALWRLNSQGIASVKKQSGSVA